MSTARYIVGDVREVLRSLPDNSVDLVLTSPPIEPFLALRSYLPADHPQKAQELGSEPTPGEFIDALLDVVEECRRVLAPHGSLCIELGDTYAGSGGAGGDYGENGLREGQPKFKARTDGGRFRAGYDRRDGRTTMQKKNYAAHEVRPVKGRTGWPQDKSLTLVPELFRFALAYGFNPLTGRATEPWRIRNVVRWVRPNPPVGALGDKFRPATSEMVVACTSRTRYFDLDAVRVPAQVQMGRNVAGNNIKGNDDRSFRFNERVDSNPVGAPPLDWWAIPTEPYPGSHYATWPRELCVRPVKAMCPDRVCRVCGEPSRRITSPGGPDPNRPQGKRAMELAEAAGLTSAHLAAVRAKGITEGGKAQEVYRGGNTAEVERLAAEAKDALGGYFREFIGNAPVTTGWSECGCIHPDLNPSSWRPGLVLDPFAGSGTTLAVATGHGRDAIGIDLDARNADLALERVGPMFLTIERYGERVA